MTEEQIKHNALAYAIENYGEYDEHDHTDHSGRNMCHAVSEKAFIAGAHSRDEEVNQLENALRNVNEYCHQLRNKVYELRHQWISAEYRLPDEGKDVFVRKACTNGIFHLVGKVLNGGKWYCYGFGWQDNGVITHWMPIPQIEKGE